MIRVALPRGDLRTPLAERLIAAGFVAEGYGEGSRSYRFSVDGRPQVLVRVFADRDIPIQIALGQYDLGITSGVWVDELLARYRHDSIVTLRALDIGAAQLVLAGGGGADVATLAAAGTVRIATEYPNLTGRYLNALRMPDYRVFTVWGQAEAWPPEDAELAVCPAQAAEREGLATLAVVQAGGARLIGNREALTNKDLQQALEPLMRLPVAAASEPVAEPAALQLNGSRGVAPSARQTARRTALRIAVPDGHAQRHTVASLTEAGIAFDGYDESMAKRRPASGIDGVEVKVLRPQDMPVAVALGLYDLALTGRDWLAAHQASFPTSPVKELLDLGRSRYQLGAVITEELPVETIDEAVAYWRRDDPQRPIRVASEYVPLADHYARERRLGRYRVIPISGASEGFVPDDAEILIEGVETGETMRANRLRMIDVIMESTSCVIGSPTRPDGRRGELRDTLIERLRAGVGTSN